jgi:hypothetical protein
MADISYEEVVKLAEQLPENEQNKLIFHLRVQQVLHKEQTQETPDEQDSAVKDNLPLVGSSEYEDSYQYPTREELIEELNNLRASGAFEHVDSLYGKYANPEAPEVSAEAFHADLHAIATKWEQELDEFDAKHD